MAIRVNAPVKVIDGYYSGKTGKVIDIFATIGTAIVSFDDNGDVGKVSISSLIEIQDQKKPVEPEIPEGAKKISRADFEVALIESHQYMMERTFRNPMSGIIGSLTGTIVGSNIADKIFKDQDVIVMTEDQLIAALWDGCSPEAVNESVGGHMGIGKAMDVSIAAIMNLRKIPGILFGGENG